MRHVLLAIIIVVVAIAIPVASPAQVRSFTEDTIGEWRARFSRNEELYWSSFAFGAFAGASAMGMMCIQAVSAGKLQAYLRTTAKPTDKLVDAVATFLANRACSTGGISAKQLSEMWQSGQDYMAGMVLVTRELEDRDHLERLVKEAAAPNADDATKALGVIAGARLVELSKRPPQPKEKWTPQSRQEVRLLD